MYFIKNLENQKFACIEDDELLEYVDRISFASSYESKKSASDDLSLITEDKENHIIVDKNGFPI